MMHLLAEYTALDSPIHRWEPRCKLLGLVTLIFAFACVQHLSFLPIVVGITALVYRLSRLPLSYLRHHLPYPGWFLVGMVGLLPFVSGQTIVWTWGWIVVRQEGCGSALLLFTRSMSIFTLSLVIFGTTPFLTIVGSLKQMGFSPVLTDMLYLSYRYVFEIKDSLSQMQTGMRLRGFSGTRGGQNIQQWVSLLGSLLIRSYEQSDRVYRAMRLRGYGKARTRREKVRLRLTQDTLALFSTLGVALVLVTTQF